MASPGQRAVLDPRLVLLYPPEQMDIFLRVFKPGGRAVWLLDQPAIELDLRNDCESQLLAELTFLMLAFNWQGFICFPNNEPFVWLADEILEVGSIERGWIEGLKSLVGCMVPEAGIQKE